MIHGPKSLYYYQNKYGRIQFYIKDDSDYELLIHKKYLKSIDDRMVSTENKEYLSQLSLYFEDCPTIHPVLMNTGYNKKSLEELFQFYYYTTKSDMTFQKKTEKFSMELGVVAGLSNTSIKFSGEYDYDYLNQAIFNQSHNVTFGLFLNVVLPRNNERFSIYNELIYTSFNLKSPSNVKNTILYNNTTFKYSYLKVMSMLRYRVPIGKLLGYINVGISNGLAFQETNYFNYGQSVEKIKPITKPRNYEQGYILGLGTNYKKYSFEFRFEKGNGFTQDVATTISTRYYLLLSYKLK